MKSLKGLSLIEIVMGVGLMFIVVAALVRLGIVTVQTSDAARIRSIAQQLAEEGLELARYERDNDPGYFFGTVPARYLGNYVWTKYDVDGQDFTSLTIGNCDPNDLSTIDTDCVLTEDVNGASVNFYRVFVFGDAATYAPEKAREVTVYVFWNNSGAYSNVKTSTILTRWRS